MMPHRAHKAKQGSPLNDNGHASVSYRDRLTTHIPDFCMFDGSCPASSPLDSSGRADLRDEARIQRGELCKWLSHPPPATTDSVDRERSRGETVA